MAATDEQVTAAYIRQEIRKRARRHSRVGNVLLINTVACCLFAAGGGRYFAEWVTGAVFSFMFAVIQFTASNYMRDPENLPELTQFFIDRAIIRSARKRQKESADG